MDFDLSEKQRLLKESLDGLLRSAYDFEARGRYLSQPGGYSREIWGRFAEQGLLGLPFTEADGGFGGGPVESMIVMEAVGRNLVVEPYLDTVVLGGGFLRRGSSAQRVEHLPGIIDGSRTVAFAQIERDSRYALENVSTHAAKSGPGYVLNGEKIAVGRGDTADLLIVTARVAGGARDPAGIGVFLVPSDAKGVSISGYAMQDGSRAADIGFENVWVEADAVIGDAEGGIGVVRRVADDARIALCAEAVGAMEEALAITVGYLKERKQFGVPIGSFQVLQHRAADMFTALETARSMSYLATMAHAFADPDERTATVAAAKVQIGRSARFVGQNSVQLHGGIGVTMEYRIGHYFKRLAMIERQFGDADYHLARVAETDGIAL